MKANKGRGGITSLTLNWALDGAVVNFTHYRFIPRETNLDTDLTGGHLGFRTGLDVLEKRKLSCLCRESKPGLPVDRTPNTLPWFQLGAKLMLKRGTSRKEHTKFSCVFTAP